MKIVVDMNHPAHVHYFKNFIWEMQGKGHEILITAGDKDLTYDLLHRFGLPFRRLGSYGTSLGQKLINIPIHDLRMYRAVKDFDPDIFLGFGSIRAAHTSAMLRKPSVLFEDTEHWLEGMALYLPFTRVVCTPSCFRRDMGRRQIRFNSYMELAYLHPRYFTPDPTVLHDVHLEEGDPYVLLRFVSWNASHDVGQSGINDKRRLIRELETYGRVFITSEEPLERALEKYRITVPPEQLHHLLYYATLYVGEGATTASECAVLGTHAVYVNTLRAGVQEEEEEKYRLVYRIPGRGSGQDVIEKAVELLGDANLGRSGKQKRQRLLEEKIDVTAFMVWFIDHFPESLSEMDEDPDIQKRFL